MPSARFASTLSAALLVMAFSSGCSVTHPQEPALVPEPVESELGAGWDTPDDAPVEPASELDPIELESLLRIQATASLDTAGLWGSALDGTGWSEPVTGCAPENITASITYMDSASGHRFGRLEVQNISVASCTVQGFPGFGARGEWGKTFLLTAEQQDPIDYSTAQDLIMLKSGESAYANVEWTGELAGAQSEPIEGFAIQLFKESEPYLIKVTGLYSERETPAPDANGMPAANTGIDISMLTTVRVGPLRQD